MRDGGFAVMRNFVWGAD
jgi:hypothetical protein